MAWRGKVDDDGVRGGGGKVWLREWARSSIITGIPRVDACTRPAWFYIDAFILLLPMHKTFYSALLFTSLSLAAMGQDDARRGAKPETAAAEERAGESRSRSTVPPPAGRGATTGVTAKAAPGAATPVPERRGFFKRLFGRRSRPAATTPTPAPKSTTTIPAPTTRKTRRPSTETSRESSSARAEKSRSKSAERSEGETKPPAASQENAKPATEKDADTARESAASSGTKKSAKTARGKGGATPPPELTTPEAQEKWKYDEARKRAMEDPEVQTMKQKADAATDVDEGRRALRAYNKTLFDKMRSLDPSVKDRIDAMEAGVMKRLGE